MRIPPSSILVHHITGIDDEQLKGLLTGDTDAVVTLLSDDEDNLKALELAYKMGVPRLVVRPNDLSNAAEMAELGALTIDPTSAMVNLLEQTVVAPQNTSILLGQDSGREVVQVTVSNKDIDGMLLRDLRLPSDVLFMDLTRGDSVILPNGYTRLQLNDDVTIVGRGDSLTEAKLKIGY